jgi:hypothetical protein
VKLFLSEPLAGHLVLGGGVGGIGGRPIHLIVSGIFMNVFQWDNLARPNLTPLKKTIYETPQHADSC